MALLEHLCSRNKESSDSEERNKSYLTHPLTPNHAAGADSGIDGHRRGRTVHGWLTVFASVDLLLLTPARIRSVGF